jgi:hypothetical protein
MQQRKPQESNTIGRAGMGANQGVLGPVLVGLIALRGGGSRYYCRAIRIIAALFAIASHRVA